MAVRSSLSRSASGVILAHLHTLRASLAKARDTLVHFKDDRVDRDKLEPAARRVDELMNLFASGSRDPEQGCLLVTEIQGGVEKVKNPKSADALRDAQVDIVALLNAMRGAGPDDHIALRLSSPVRY
jgi:plasmid stabilization system protein ParE